MSISSWVDSQNMVSLFNRILFIHKKEWSVYTGYSMDEASHKIPHIKWFHLYEISIIGKYIERECNLVIALGYEVWVNNWVVIAKGY